MDAVYTKLLEHVLGIADDAFEAHKEVYRERQLNAALKEVLLCAGPELMEKYSQAVSDIEAQDIPEETLSHYHRSREGMIKLIQMLAGRAYS